MQLFEAARQRIAGESNPRDVANFFRDYASFIFRMQAGETWQLQLLTDLKTLPDYEPSERWGFRGGRGRGNSMGAPVDADGSPVFYAIPASFEAAANDGERWRFCLEQSAQKDAGLRTEADWKFAEFLHSQFGVQTLRLGGFNLPVPEGDSQVDPRTNIWSLPTLGDNETICRLASGPKRLPLPDEFNPLSLFRKIKAGNDKNYAGRAADQIAGIYEDRQQYVKAAKAWQDAISQTGNFKHRQFRLDQIVKPWGEFEPTSTHPAGQGPTLDFKFRNGRKLELEAFPIRIDLLLADMKAHLKSNPQNVDWKQIHLEQIGFRLVQENQLKYLNSRVAQWSVALEPRAEHLIGSRRFPRRCSRRERIS